MARRQLFDGSQVGQDGQRTTGQSLLTQSPTRISVIGGSGGNAVNAVRQQIIFGTPGNFMNISLILAYTIRFRSGFFSTVTEKLKAKKTQAMKKL